MTIGQLIEKEMIRQQWNKSEFAKQIGISRNGLYGLLTRSTIDTEMLFRVSVLLNYDFFKAYSIRFENRASTLEEPSTVYERNRDVDVNIKMRMPNYLAKEIGLGAFIEKHSGEINHMIE